MYPSPRSLCLQPLLTSKQFEKVFVLNLPERPDKLDAMRLTAALTGFEFDVIDGIKGEMLSPKALPGVGQSLSSTSASMGP